MTTAVKFEEGFLPKSVVLLKNPVMFMCVTKSWAWLSTLIGVSSLTEGFSEILVAIVNSIVNLLNHGRAARIHHRGGMLASGG